MPKVNLKVRLLRHTAQPDEMVAMAARLCYSDADIDTLEQGVQTRDQAKYIQRLMDMGHFSPVEHASFTFGIEGVSRALLAQITRHRLASFSVKSQRYVGLAGKGEDGFNYILPPAIEALGPDAVREYHQQMITMQKWYDGWVDRLGAGRESTNEDARFVLPNAAETKLVMTMNARELMHFFSLRCCNRAQWEIRALAWAMLEQVMEVAPAIFKHAGPGCVTGPCPEGKKTCGRIEEVRARQKALRQKTAAAAEDRE
jgi:thymidylate synthase (FAD)